MAVIVCHIYLRENATGVEPNIHRLREIQPAKSRIGVALVLAFDWQCA
jgi:hypothetical protein